MPEPDLSAIGRAATDLDNEPAIFVFFPYKIYPMKVSIHKLSIWLPINFLLLISNRFRGLGPVAVEHVRQSDCTLMTLAFPHKISILVSLGGDEISSRQLIRESVGRQFSAETKDIEHVCRQAADSLKNYYSIGYLAEIKAGDITPRKIRIRVPERKFTVYFRRTYIPG